jgi:hypothetical protein
MAHVDNIRAPVTSKIISGIKGLMGAHPVGQIAGIGNAKKSRQANTVRRTLSQPEDTEDPLSDYLGAMTASEDEYF